MIKMARLTDLIKDESRLTTSSCVNGKLKKTICKHISRRGVGEAVIETSFGAISIKLLPEIAPETVRNFEKLARDGFYSGTLFHRVIPGFMIQGGDPNTRSGPKETWGTGGPGYSIKAEFNPKPHARGIVSMARATDPDSAGSQFFIVVKDSMFLNGQYTAFGEVTAGMEVADHIVSLERDAQDCPRQEARIKSVTVSS